MWGRRRVRFGQQATLEGRRAWSTFLVHQRAWVNSSTPRPQEEKDFCSHGDCGASQLVRALRLVHSRTAAGTRKGGHVTTKAHMPRRSGARACWRGRGWRAGRLQQPLSHGTAGPSSAPCAPAASVTAYVTATNQLRQRRERRGTAVQVEQQAPAPLSPPRRAQDSTSRTAQA